MIRNNGFRVTLSSEACHSSDQQTSHTFSITSKVSNHCKDDIDELKKNPSFNSHQCDIFAFSHTILTDDLFLEKLLQLEKLENSFSLSHFKSDLFDKMRGEE